MNIKDREAEQARRAELEAKRTPGEVEEVLGTICQALGLRPKFFDDLLLEDDDWTVVIKCHALLESVSCQLIATELGRTELEGAFARLGIRAKMGLLKTLKLVSPEELKMMEALSDLRNDVVHDVKQTDFAFAEHLKDKNRRDSFVAKFGLGFDETVEVDGEQVEKAVYVLSQPKVHLWLCVLRIATRTATQKMQFELDKQRDAAINALRRRLPKSEAASNDTP